MSKLYDVIFDQCKTWVKKKRNKGVSWEELKYACKNNEKGLNDFLEARKEDDDWPEERKRQILRLPLNLTPLL